MTNASNLLKVLAAVAAVATLAGCGQSSTDNASTADASAGLTVVSYRDASLERAGGAITVTRTGEGNQGVYIWRSPALVTFTVQGENARLRVREGGRDRSIPLQETNTVLLGPGGLSRILVVSDNAATLVVNVTSIVDCAVEAARCEALVVAEPEEAASDAAPAETAAPPAQ